MIREPVAGPSVAAPKVGKLDGQMEKAGLQLAVGRFSKSGTRFGCGCEASAAHNLVALFVP